MIQLGFNVDGFIPHKHDLPSKNDLIISIDNHEILTNSNSVKSLRDWVQKGGRLLLASNPEQAETFNKLIKSFGLHLEKRQIFGENWQFYYRAQGNPFLLYPRPQLHQGFDINSEKQDIIMSRSAPLVADTEIYSPLLKTSKDAYAKPVVKNQNRIDPKFDKQKDVRGPFTVAYASENYGKGRLIVFGGHHLFSDQLIDQQDNKQFIIELLKWYFRCEGCLS